MYHGMEIRTVSALALSKFALANSGCNNLEVFRLNLVLQDPSRSSGGTKEPWKAGGENSK